MPTQTVATWNVNSIRTRQEQVLDWLRAHEPAVLCLQETKTPDDRFPAEAFEAAGYRVAASGQRTYNGVAILSREPLGDVAAGFPGDPDPAQARVLSGTWRDLRIVDVYVPNGSEVGSPSYEYKLAWLQALRAWLERDHDPAEPLLMLGDFNIAPEERDVWDPERWKEKVLCSEPEREALRRLQRWGLRDLFRRHHDEGGLYSWWDYRRGRFRRDQGLRIDLLLGTDAVARRAAASSIDREPRKREQPSDHAPVRVELEMPG
ncbi:MAG: exodeoxyribonuclease III [Acidobacteriota bacterium]|jgi:exodeoxyribonuclease-3